MNVAATAIAKLNRRAAAELPARRAAEATERAAADAAAVVARRAAWVRAYAQGAVVDRLSGDWRLSSVSGNQEMRADLRELRRRARALFRDDPYINAAVRAFVQNIVGADGVRLHPTNLGRDGKPSDKANTTLADAWKEWGLAENCSVDGIESFVEFQQRVVETWVVDGEAFVRKHIGFQGSAHFYALELIDADLLDELYNRGPDAQGRQVVAGVEVDRYGRPLFYHFWTRHPSEAGPRERIPVPAAEIVHVFKRKRASQVRAYTLLAPIIFRLHMLGAYEDAEVTGARISSSKMGFFEVDKEFADAWEPPEPGTNYSMPVQPGMAEQLPPGLTFKEWDPKHPNAAFAAFVKSILRSIAVGLGLAFETLTGDLEGVNYSSIRAGLIVERDFWEALQGWFASRFMRPVFVAWLDVAILTPSLSSLPSRDPLRWQSHEWRGRGWAWVDPYNDVRTAEMEIALGLKSRQMVCAEKGRDFRQVVAELKAEDEIAKEAGVNIGGIAAKQDVPQPVDGDPAIGEDGSNPKDASNPKDSSGDTSNDATKKPAKAA